MKQQDQKAISGSPKPPKNVVSSQNNPYAIRDLASHFQQALHVSTPPQQESSSQASTPQPKAITPKPYIFDPMCVMDIEMTDTDPHKGRIAEIACYLVSGDLRQQILIASLVIKLDMSELKTDEVIKRFTKSGLWQELQNPEKVTPLIEAEELIIKQFEEYGITHSQIPSAGIQSYNDRIILEREMPSFNKFLNFTIIDISSVDEVASRWSKRVFNKREAKESRHRAEPNARRAITRLQYYKAQLFKKQDSPNPSPYPERGNQFYSDAWAAPWSHYVEYKDEQTWDSSSEQQQQQQQHLTYSDVGKPAFYPGQNFFGDRD
ncbi:hypothetical protein FGO68_gene13436 [Halteria grandinella]|uniref:Exonuclease domain-containing protein n=1 Tax=Halteria grandinella TaxID=5974 RepID=A0A8J8TAA7_HALGN|nr:hypothetical protein FGO68_gene13436 [Halteria grandinella]